MPGHARNHAVEHEKPRATAGVEVPDRKRFIAGTRNDASSVRADSHRIHPVLMPFERVDELAGLEVPNCDDVVL